MQLDYQSTFFRFYDVVSTLSKKLGFGGEVAKKPPSLRLPYMGRQRDGEGRPPKDHVVELVEKEII